MNILKPRPLNYFSIYVYVCVYTFAIEMKLKISLINIYLVYVDSIVLTI